MSAVARRRRGRPKMTYEQRRAISSEVMKLANAKCPRGMSRAERLRCLSNALREVWQQVKAKYGLVTPAPQLTPVFFGGVGV